MDDLTQTRNLLKLQLSEAIEAEPLDALTAIGAAQRDIAALQTEAVRAAVQQHSWAEIGDALGVSKQAAHQRFAREWAGTLKDEMKAETKALRAALRDNARDRAATARAKRDELIAEFKKANRRGK